MFIVLRPSKVISRLKTKNEALGPLTMLPAASCAGVTQPFWLIFAISLAALTLPGIHHQTFMNGPNSSFVWQKCASQEL